MAHHPNPAVDRILVHKAALEERISEELKRPLPDSVKLQSLKRERLSLKDRATHLMNSQPNEIMPTPARIA